MPAVSQSLAQGLELRMTVISGKEGQTRLMRGLPRIGSHGQAHLGLPATQPGRVFSTGPVRGSIGSQGRVAVQTNMRSRLPERAQQPVLGAGQH